jgi:hypothetical protein
MIRVVVSLDKAIELCGGSRSRQSPQNEGAHAVHRWRSIAERRVRIHPLQQGVRYKPEFWSAAKRIEGTLKKGQAPSAEKDHRRARLFIVQAILVSHGRAMGLTQATSHSALFAFEVGP